MAKNDEWDRVGSVYRRKPKKSSSLGDFIGGIGFIVAILIVIGAIAG